MDIVLFLLSFFSIALMLVGLIKPSILSRLLRRKDKLSRKKIFVVFGGATILLFFLFMAVIVADSPDRPAEPVNTPEKQTDENGSDKEQTPEETQPPLSTQQPTDSSKELIKVIRVIDGDTIEVEGGNKVRYIGIDTPETVHPSKPVECYGKEASEKNKELVEGKMVYLEKDVSEVDEYGRLLRYVWVNNLFINEYLVREGYAQSSSYPPDVKYQDRIVEAQRQAREEEKGLWGSFCDTWENETYTSVSTPTNRPNNNTGSFTCNCNKTYSQISSCEEAYYQLNNCGCSERDGDKDGVPCENICSGG